MSFAWSWSALDNFETCPKKYYHTRIKKDYVEPDGEHLTRGKQIHDALADRITKGRRLPKEMPFEKHVERVMENSDRTQVTVKTEQRMALTVDLHSCDFFDKQAAPWVRSVADVLKVRENPGIARVVDWKTGGKPGKSFIIDEETGEATAVDPGQLKLSAAIVMATYPEVDVVRTEYVWLDHDVVTEETYTRHDLAKIWSGLLPRVDRMEEAYRTTEYLPKPSGLCVKHCPVTGCPYHGRGNR